jgi:hypothetical protein
MRLKSFVHHTPYTFSPLEGEPEGVIFGIFGYFRKQPSECLSRQSVETEGMEDGRKLAY